MSMLEAKLGCKKHPYNNPQQGVCSSCLAEKLSNLSTPCNYHYPNYPKNNSVSNSSSTKSKYSTQLGAATNHKIHDYDHDSIYSSGTDHARHGSIDHIGNVVGDNNIDGIRKSRSMIAWRKSQPDDDAVVIKKKGGGGFLAKLIRSTSKTTKDDHVVISTDHSRSATTMFVPTKV